MCGILFTNFKNLNQRSFKKSLKLIRHRGPDSSKFIRVNGNYLGFNRLSIIDLTKNADQPKLSSNERYIIIYNGEIYNFYELKNKYNINTKKNSDTEVLLELFSKYKTNILNELNGMFSFIIYDIHKNNYFIVRDRLGIKPLYYYVSGDKFIYSSELSPILNILEINNKKITYDKIAIRQIKQFRNYFDDRTIYEQIKTFPPGSFLFKKKFYKYWDLTPKNNKFDFEEFSDLLKSSIKLRTIADVKVGSFLSGGIDSTIITKLAKPSNSWSIGLKNFNEFDYVKKVNKSILNNTYIYSYDQKNFNNDLKKILKVKKEPVLIPNEVLLSALTSKIKLKNKVVLSGEGSDELFYGYDRIFRWAVKSSWNTRDFVSLYCYGDGKDNEVINDVIKNHIFKFKSNELNISYFFQIHHLRGLLNRLDFSTMLHSVEARSPFLDFRLIEYLFGINKKYKISKNDSKIILKKFCQRKIPASIVKRKKVGFPVKLDNMNFLEREKRNTFMSWIDYNLDLLIKN